MSGQQTTRRGGPASAAIASRLSNAGPAAARPAACSNLRLETPFIRFTFELLGQTRRKTVHRRIQADGLDCLQTRRLHGLSTSAPGQETRDAESTAKRRKFPDIFERKERASDVSASEFGNSIYLTASRSPRDSGRMRCNENFHALAL